MSNRSSHFVHRLQALPAALGGVSGSRRLLLLAAVLALLALTLLPTTAQAASTQHWSATLTPTTLSVDRLGCSSSSTDASALCTSSSRLTDDSFEYDGTTYRVDLLALSSNGQLWFEVNADYTAATLSDLTLNIGDTRFHLSDRSTLSGGLITWANTGLTWTADTPVAVTLTAETVEPDDVAVVPQRLAPDPYGGRTGAAVPPAIRHVHQPRRLVHRHRRLQHVRPEPGRRRA